MNAPKNPLGVGKAAGRTVWPASAGQITFGGADDKAHWITIPSSAKCLIVGPTSDVAIYRVKPANSTIEFLLATDAPLIGESPEFEFQAPILIKPYIVTPARGGFGTGQPIGYQADVLYYKEVPYFLPLKRPCVRQNTVLENTLGTAVLTTDALWINGRKLVRVRVKNHYDQQVSVAINFLQWMGDTVSTITAHTLVVAASTDAAYEFAIGDGANTGALSGADLVQLVGTRTGGGTANLATEYQVEAFD